MNSFMIILDKSLADKYIKQGFSLLHTKDINGVTGYVFSTKDEKLNFSLEDKKKILFTNKLTF